MPYRDDIETPVERILTVPPRMRRPRSMSSTNVKSTALEILGLRLQSIPDWGPATDAFKRAIHAVVGEAYDHGERRNEHKRLKLEGELIDANARIAELEGQLANDRRDRAIASTIPPPPGGDGEE